MTEAGVRWDPQLASVLFLGSAMFSLAACTWAFTEFTTTIKSNESSMVILKSLVLNNAQSSESMIHAALLVLAAISWNRNGNLLSGCMCWCGTLFILIISMPLTVLSLSNLMGWMMPSDGDWFRDWLPLIVSLWFLLSSMVGFYHSIKHPRFSSVIRHIFNNHSDHSNNDPQLPTPSLSNTRLLWCSRLCKMSVLSLIWFAMYILTCFIMIIIYHHHSMDEDNIGISSLLRGMTVSFTMTFHFAFLESCHLNAVLDPRHLSTVLICLLASFLPGLLYSFYLIHNIHWLITHDHHHHHHHHPSDSSISITMIISLFFLCSRLMIEILRCFIIAAGIYPLADSTIQLKPSSKERLRIRPSMLHLIMNRQPIRGDILEPEWFLNKRSRVRKAALSVSIGSCSVCLCFGIETIILVLFQNNDNDNDDVHSMQSFWDSFDWSLLWLLHSMALLVSCLHISVQFNDTFLRMCELMLRFYSLVSFASLLDLFTYHRQLRYQSHSSISMIIQSLLICRLIASLITVFGYLQFKSMDNNLRIIEMIDGLHPLKDKEQRESEEDESALFIPKSVNKKSNSVDQREKTHVPWILAYLITTVAITACSLAQRLDYDARDPPCDLFRLHGSPHRWTLLGGSTAMFPFLFHSGFLLTLFIYDGTVTQRWAPSMDLAFYGLITSMIIYLLFSVLSFCREPGFTTLLLVWCAVCCARLARALWCSPRLFVDQPSLFL